MTTPAQPIFPPLNKEAIQRLIRLGLAEDFAHGPDATSVATIDMDAVLTAQVVPRQDGTCLL